MVTLRNRRTLIVATARLDGQRSNFIFDQVDVDRILVHACGGDDRIVIPDSFTIDAVVHAGESDDIVTGGSGNDLLIGGPGNDLLLGASGNDSLLGQAGNDVLIGGLGADDLLGGFDDDLLIGGYTQFDESISSLDRILTRWSSDLPYEERVADLRHGKRPFLTASSRGATVFDDSAVDQLSGEEGRDWFFASLNDELIDNETDESWDLLP